MPKRHKIYVFGGHGVGKTSMIDLLIHGSISQEPYTTIEDIYDIILESDRGIKERISLFDTGGLDDETSSVPNYYLATADAAIFVFSLDSIASFELAKRLKTETAKIRGNDMPMLIVGTKSDLSHQRQVSKSSINSSSRDCKVKIFEIIYDEKDSLKVPFTWLVSRLADKNSSQQTSKLFRAKKSVSLPANLSD
ncbi:NF-kappa-B inhibitor-interacting Ras-like protein 1 [Trichoplax sp. H2]|nr:NF-kappa-B inhibitor-interacting Ras-like protein 1 [Trichoplax sp. H2]|eukprot:RDD39693.1 NF-kappa-B inhibitor-interacting Ras-like protein 1 [Trichoplax sp. H2]